MCPHELNVHFSFRINIIRKYLDPRRNAQSQFSESEYLRRKNDVDRESRSEDVWRRLVKEVLLYTLVLIKLY